MQDNRRTPLTVQELTGEAEQLAAYAYSASILSARLESSLSLAPHITPEICANVREYQREANALADRLFAMFENGVAQQRAALETERAQQAVREMERAVDKRTEAFPPLRMRSPENKPAEVA